MPFFSIIIPAYNREQHLRRALDSVLAQAFDSFEVIVVDDASTDGTLAFARDCADPRVRIVARTVNGGPCQARNSGVDVAAGRWLVMLDSDDSLQPDALATLHTWCESASPATGNCISACRRDTGGITPRPMPPPRMNYDSYLCWLEEVEISDYLNCIRRDVFKTVRYASSRAWELSFHLGLARHWSLEFHAETLVVVHTDATNRLTTGKGAPALRRMLTEAADKLADGLAILTEHQTALRRLAPRFLAGLRRELLKQALLAGQRRIALGIARSEMRSLKWDVKLVVIIAAGLFHRVVLARLSARF